MALGRFFGVIFVSFVSFNIKRFIHESFFLKDSCHEFFFQHFGGIWEAFGSGLSAFGAFFVHVCQHVGQRLSFIDMLSAKTLQRFVLCLCGRVKIIPLDRTGMSDIWEDLGEIWERFWRCLGILANKHEFQDGSKTVTGFCHGE